MRLLATIEIYEKAIGCRGQVFVMREVVRTQGNTAKKLVENFCPIFGRKGVRLVEQLLGALSHAIGLALNVFRVKSSGIPEA